MLFLAPTEATPFSEYCDACTNCETWVSIDRDQHQKLKRIMAYDKRKSGGSKGLALTRDFVELNLLKGDRVEFVEGAVDAQGFFGIDSYPARVCFWRVTKESICRRRNPLFSEATGMVPDDVVAFDWLHTLSLGVFQFYLAHLMQCLLIADIWETSDTNMVSKLATSTARLAADVGRWQKAEGKKNEVLLRFI